MTPRLGAARRALVAAATASLLVACTTGAAGPGSGGPSGPTTLPTLLRSPSSAAPVVWCPITRGDGSIAPTGTSPAGSPAGLPVASIPPGDAVYGVFFAPWSSHATLYAVGPRAARCDVSVGTGFGWRIGDPSAPAFSYEESWSVAPPMWMGCPYLPAARRAWVSYMGTEGEASASMVCAPVPGERTVRIPAAQAGLELALVWAGPPRELGPTLRLHGYRGDGAPGGFGFVAKCPVAGDVALRCAVALAFVAWSVGGGEAAADAVVGVPIGSPAP